MKKVPFNQIVPFEDIRQLLGSCRERFGDRTAFKQRVGRDQARATTYAQFADQVEALAAALDRQGWADKRIAVLGENSYPWALTYFAVLYLGAVIVPLDKELSPEQMAEALTRAQAKVLVHTLTYAEEAEQAARLAGGVALVSMEPRGQALSLPELVERGMRAVSKGADVLAERPLDRDAPCAILFTSGTTGRSKGVTLSQRNLAANVRMACQLVTYRPDDVMLSILPMHHTYEAMAGLLCPLYYGACVAFCPGPKALPACLKLFAPTVMVLVPLYVQTLHRRIWQEAAKRGLEGKLRLGIGLCNALAKIGVDLRGRVLRAAREGLGGRLRLIICGGSALDPALIPPYRDLGVQILQGYGITECSPIISANRNRYNRDGSVGPIPPLCQVRFDEAGQLMVKGPHVMLGYWQDESATREAFRDGWFLTGDLGYQDADGFLYITGRCKDLIVLKNGKNILPQQVEAPLVAQDIVAEAVVKAQRGEEGLMAVIYPEPALSAGMTDEALRQAVQRAVDAANEQLAYYQRVRAFTLRDTPFEKTTTQKIMRYRV